LSAEESWVLNLRFTDKEITAWGGMAIMKRMLDHLGFDAALTAAGLPQPKSNRGYRPEQLITQFLLSIWCGAIGLSMAKSLGLILFEASIWFCSHGKL